MEGEIVESPRKRIKTDTAPSTEDAVLPSGVAVAAPAPSADSQALKEIEVGITEFVSAENEGYAAILKKRYTDFLVNEILPSGQVLHLRSGAPPKPTQEQNKDEQAAEPTVEAPSSEPAAEQDATKENATEEFKLSDSDKALLESYFSAEIAEKIIQLHSRVSTSSARPGDLGKVNGGTITDRDLRTNIHQAIRRIFNSQLESSTDSEGVMTIAAAPNRNKRNGKGGGRGNKPDRRPNWEELGGPYLHFTIYKENKDTMEIISYLARQLKVHPKSIQFAGTKDRRGVTVQRACVHKLQAERLAKINATLRNATLGDFEYCRQGLELGDLEGNEFVITLRDCDIPGVDLADRENVVAKTKTIVDTSLRNLRERGYFNYYGLQRFGTFSTRTDMVGVKMLQGDFEGACNAILDFSPHVLAAAQEGENSTAMISADDRARAEAINIFKIGQNVANALEKMPRKFSAESNLIRHLGRAKKDHLGALQTIPRNLRLMYVHAYQSRVWNFAVGERWRLYGDKVVEGDLVIVHEHRDKEGTADGADTSNATIDADGEVIIRPQVEDSSCAVDDAFTRARALTAAEAASGKYSIFDIVLPLPGFDIIYPPNQMTDFYKTFMGENGGIDPFDMRRKWKDISLSGSYRKVLSRMGPDYSFDVKLYSQDDEQFVRTDLDILRRGEAEAEAEAETGADAASGDKVAIILKFQLGSSQYATMALRELMKGKVKAFQPDFGGGR
ncbi:hypothetical protein ASPWEDRAFT_182910 [Aspergillus wentii DTO 134E9]|uniref:TRUD domain-containing protein n=1 Tax=Aspergillus wentii DTO 134E9 TaxID=1073089 RepID=A0A1L9RIT0_ASPWE|nr:uncharacterized protein ASPWEDRAFT_182910 [Aspergillus wentii DTO 134E9]KAI9932270.1 hypothetical protein MW887_009781 [Aspergillus wentii]OJJ34768.1 hypothetical protein ASPWEDRAFT_182910 [Aspergillus wentii DTO 134E9]